MSRTGEGEGEASQEAVPLIPAGSPLSSSLGLLTPQDYEGIWEYYEGNGKNFFETVEIVRDGGLSEVSELFNTWRYFTSARLVFFVFLNVYFILSVSLPLVAQPDHHKSRPEIFTITKSFVLRPVSSATGVFDANVLPDLLLVGCLELGLLLWQLLRLSGKLWAILLQPLRRREPYDRWHAVQELFWIVLPELSTLSGFWTLHCVTPAVLLPKLSAEIGRLGSRGSLAGTLALLGFLASHLGCFLVGFDAFLFKLQLVSEEMHVDPTTEEPSDHLNLLFLSLSFLNQLLGIVRLDWIVRTRIFAFIFAGEDCFLSDAELALEVTWESMLAMKIWTEPSFSWYQKLAVHLSFSDVDFQRLALDTVEKRLEGKPGRVEEEEVDPAPGP